MSGEAPHLSDERLLLLVDDELPRAHADAARRHLQECGQCRARAERIESSAAAFGRAYRTDRDTHRADLDSASRSREALKSQLADIKGRSRARPSWATACAIALTALIGLDFLFSRSEPAAGAGVRHAAAVRPIAYLTPGATRQVAVADLCSGRRTPRGPIPPRVRQAVLRDYSMEMVAARDYELDYLITPELGGADDRSNLWPERYSSDVWNARVKDELEVLLPRLVCAGTLSLTTAQRDIATDWIAAYKKYFHTDRPLHMYSAHAGLDVQDGLASDDERTGVMPLELPAPRHPGR